MIPRRQKEFYGFFPIVEEDDELGSPEPLAEIQCADISGKPPKIEKAKYPIREYAHNPHPETTNLHRS